MNTHRITHEIGSLHFRQNPVGALHRGIDEHSIAAVRRRCAMNAMDSADFGGIMPKVKNRAMAWRLAHGASAATRALRPYDNAVDNVFGSCLAHRPIGRPAWESEGFLAQLGRVPLHGLTLLGAHVGGAYATVRGTNRDVATARGARWGARIGGAVAYAWSQGLALAGFVAKVAARVPVTAYLTLVHIFDPFERSLARDALCGAGYKLSPGYL